MDVTTFSSMVTNLTLKTATSGRDLGQEPNYNTSDLLHNFTAITTLVIIMVGLVGNICSIAVFTRTSLNTLSAAVYLTALAVVDTGFLVQLLASWMGFLHVNVFHRDGLCQIFVFLTYVTSFMSVWLVVSFTAERYVVVCYPLARRKLCTTQRAKLIVLIMTLFAMGFYSFSLWTSEIQYQHDIPRCSFKPSHHLILKVMSSIDFTMTFVIPVLAICWLNISIVVSSCRFQKRRRLLADRSFQASQTRPSTKSRSSSFKNIIRTSFSNNNIRQGSLKKWYEAEQVPLRQCHMTKLLVVVSSVFVLLNLPSHCIKIHYILMTTIQDDYAASNGLMSAQEIASLVHYCNFSVNFVLYSLCGRNFRCALRALCGCTGGVSGGGAFARSEGRRTHIRYMAGDSVEGEAAPTKPTGSRGSTPRTSLNSIRLTSLIRK